MLWSKLHLKCIFCIFCELESKIYVFFFFAIWLSSRSGDIWGLPIFSKLLDSVTYTQMGLPLHFFTFCLAIFVFFLQYPIVLAIIALQYL